MLLLVQWLMYYNGHRVIVSSVRNFMQYCIVWCKEKGEITRKEEGGFLSSMLLFASSLQIAFLFVQ